MLRGRGSTAFPAAHLNSTVPSKNIYSVPNEVLTEKERNMRKMVGKEPPLPPAVRHFCTVRGAISQQHFCSLSFCCVARVKKYTLQYQQCTAKRRKEKRKKKRKTLDKKYQSANNHFNHRIHRATCFQACPDKVPRRHCG